MEKFEKVVEKSEKVEKKSVKEKDWEKYKNNIKGHKIP